jgi:hypothetical protein
MTDPNSRKPAFFTIWSDEWRVRAEDLMGFHPKRIWGPLRNDLNRSQRGRGDGWLFAGLHAYFDASTNEFGFHVHGQAQGGMINRLEALRDYRPAKYSNCENGGGSIQIVRRQTNLPEPLTYCLQSFWNWLYYVDGETGEVRKHTRRRRIPAPHDSLYLMWLDQFRLEDLTMLMGLRATMSGLNARQS